MQPVTCVIPCYRAANTIVRAVQSAYDAGCDRVCVCCDDRLHDDETFQTVKNIYNQRANGDLKFIWFHNETRCGASVTRNHMIESPLCKDSLIVCLDADDELVNIQTLIDAWQPNTFVYGNHNEISGNTTTPHKGAPIGTLRNKLVSGVTFLFHKDDWQRVGGFDPDFAVMEDWSFMVALVASGVQGKYVDTTVYNRYLRPEGNERTALAGQYWSFYREMAKRKWPQIFT